MPRRTRKQPTDSLKLEPDLLARVKREYRHVLSVLDSWRDRLMHRRLGAAEKQLGRSPGYLGHVVHERDTITVERLLGFIALAGRSLLDFVECLVIRERIPASPSPRYLRPYLPRERQYEKLETWAGSVELSSSGDTLSTDPDLVLRRAEQNREEGLALAEKYLDVAMDLLTEKVAPDAAEGLCRVLGSLAFLQRERGKHGASAELLKTAFRLERKLDDRLELRAFLYRGLAYLLADLGEVVEAERCACRARDLCLASLSEGLGESLFARAMMVKWQGDSGEALRLFRGVLPHAHSRRPLQAATSLQEAWLSIELEDRAGAHTVLEALEPVLDELDGQYRASSQMARAVLASLAGQESKADAAFEDAWSFYRELESAGDQAVFLLRRCQHLLRYGRPMPGEDLLPLTRKMTRGSAGEAAVVEAARLMLAGSITDQVLGGMIRELERPWTRTRRVRAAS